MGISVVIPTLGRETELLETIRLIAAGSLRPDEILVVDQTLRHSAGTEAALSRLDREGAVRWMRLAQPSIPHAMNVGLARARCSVILFLDDDVVPGPRLVEEHLRAHTGDGWGVVMGQVLQPGEEPDSEARSFRFNSSRSQMISNLMVMGCNFSVRRRVALEAGGFDENFVRVAYRFEAEFARRLEAAGHRIWFEPRASIRHLRVATGGTRSFGDHLRTARPGHSVGAYYYLLRATSGISRLRGVAGRLLRSIITRHHLRRPWWIAPTLVAECFGLAWACRLAQRGPRLIDRHSGLEFED